MPITYDDFVGGEREELPAALNEIKSVVNALSGGGISAVTVQENDVEVGSEDTLNFEDGDNFGFTVSTDGSVITIRGDATTTASVWRNGTGAPSNALGSNGDYYLNTTTGAGKGDVYKKSGGVYTVVGSILGATGATGATGAAGTNGATWRDGAGAPDNGVGANGDYYLDTTNGDVYERAAGTYSVVGNIMAGGDVNGPASSVDNALPRFDGTSGETLQESLVIVGDDGSITLPEMAAPSTPASGNVVIYPKADGKVYAKDDAGTETNLSSGGDVTTGGTQTLTNKRITRRVTTEVSSATPTINTDNSDVHHITALATNITSMTTNLSGTPTAHQLLHIVITSGASQTIAWGASFEASSVALPDEVDGTIDVLFRWNATSSKFRILATV